MCLLTKALASLQVILNYYFSQKIGRSGDGKRNILWGWSISFISENIVTIHSWCKLPEKERKKDVKKNIEKWPRPRPRPGPRPRPRPRVLGAFHSTKNSGNSGLGSEWNRHFPEFHSEILGVPREVGLKFRRIGITGKFRSIRPFLLVPSFPEPDLKLLNEILVLYQTNDWNILMQRYYSGLASQALVSSAKNTELREVWA